MRIIGIDPGTGILGFGVIETDGQKNQLVDAGVIRTPVKEDDAVRLQTIFEEITDIIAETKPHEMSIEKLFFAQNVTTAMTVAQARGVVLLAGMQAGLKIAEYTPANQTIVDRLRPGREEADAGNGSCPAGPERCAAAG
jgi:crossover junction endodeoxyribonuclease RuvC